MKTQETQDPPVKVRRLGKSGIVTEKLFNFFFKNVNIFTFDMERQSQHLIQYLILRN